MQPAGQPCWRDTARGQAWANCDKRRGAACFGTFANKTHRVLAVVSRFGNQNVPNSAAGCLSISCRCHMDHLQLLQSTCLNTDRTMGLELCSNEYFKVLQKMQMRSMKELHPTPYSEQCPLWRSTTGTGIDPCSCPHCRLDSKLLPITKLNDLAPNPQIVWG